MKVIYKSVGVNEMEANLVGLVPCRLDRLSDINFFVGSNGAGKSRMLHLLRKKFDFIKQSEFMFADLEQNKRDLVRLKSGDERDARRVAQLAEFVEAYDGAEAAGKYIDVYRISSDAHRIESTGTATRDDIRNSRPLDDRDFNIEDGASRAFRVLQFLAERHLVAVNPSSSFDGNRREEAIEQWDLAKNLVKQILNLELSIVDGDNAAINGLPLDSSGLSEGQSKLIALVVALLDGGTNPHSKILIIDEIERFLHPSAAIFYIERIRSVLPDCQLFLSTHSLPLVAWAHQSSCRIFFMLKGETIGLRDDVTGVVSGLLGGESNISSLSDFLLLPDELALLRFANECLMEPLVAEPNDEDPQSTQIREILGGLSIGSQSNGRLSILDFGAGRGRIGQMLHNRSTEALGEGIHGIDYFAYNEENCSEMQECIENVVVETSTYKGSHINGPSELNALELRFDCILMCNVLHEIPPSQWREEFELIKSVLGEEGSLLIVEDLQIRTGEKAYTEGFCVLHEQALNELLVGSETPIEGVYHERKGEPKRLACFKITQDRLEVTEDSILAAVKCVQENALSEVKSIRSQGQDTKLGRKHAFYLVQYANTQLLLDSFSEDRSAA